MFPTTHTIDGVDPLVPAPSLLNLKIDTDKTVSEIIGKSHYQGRKRTQCLRCAIL